MQTYINNSINGFFILTPHFDENGKIICVYNKFDKNKKLEFVVDEEIYHVEETTDKNTYGIYTYNNNLIIALNKSKRINNEMHISNYDYSVDLYYYLDENIHKNIFSFTETSDIKNFVCCKSFTVPYNIKHSYYMLFSYIKKYMYDKKIFSEKEKELYKLFEDMYYKIGMITEDEINCLTGVNKWANKFNKNN